MKAPFWFVNDLKLIHPKYFAVFDDRRQKYYIRKWHGPHARPRTWRIDSTPICQVPYPALDERILHYLRKGLYWGRKAKELALQVDAENEREMEREEMEHEYVTRYMAKKIYGYYREKILDLGNKNLAPKKVTLGEL